MKQWISNILICYTLDHENSRGIIKSAFLNVCMDSIDYYPDEAESILCNEDDGEAVDDEVDMTVGISKEKKSFLYDMLSFRVPEKIRFKIKMINKR